MNGYSGSISVSGDHHFIILRPSGKKYSTQWHSQAKEYQVTFLECNKTLKVNPLMIIPTIVQEYSSYTDYPACVMLSLLAAYRTT